VVVIAQDAQGAEVAKPWVEKAGATFRSLLDQENQVGKSYALKYVPVAILLDASGKLVRPVSSVNIDQEAFRTELEEWVEHDRIPASWAEGKSVPVSEMSSSEEEADARFQLGVVLLRNQKREEAIEQFRAAMVLDPDNWLIRKQLWALETPEAFYEGDVDYAWQKEQVVREASLIEG
jgi:tetratricopeptide (TPR) repeat protein